ncbi:hypothetical protein [Gordonia sputi]
MIVAVSGLVLTGCIAAVVWWYLAASRGESDVLGRVLLLVVLAAACAGAAWGLPFSGQVRSILVLGGCAVLAPYALIVAATVEATASRTRRLSTASGSRRRNSEVAQLLVTTLMSAALVMLYILAAASVAVLVYVVVSQGFAEVR